MEENLKQTFEKETKPSIFSGFEIRIEKSSLMFDKKLLTSMRKETKTKLFLQVFLWQFWTGTFEESRNDFCRKTMLYQDETQQSMFRQNFSTTMRVSFFSLRRYKGNYTESSRTRKHFNYSIN